MTCLMRWRRPVTDSGLDILEPSIRDKLVQQLIIVQSRLRLARELNDLEMVTSHEKRHDELLDEIIRLDRS